MFKQFRDFKKYKEYISWEFENKFAFWATCIMIIVGLFVKLYDNLNLFIIFINDICVALIGAYVGSLALIFSGVVFLGGLLNGRFEKELIKYAEDDKATEKLYLSYLFLAFNILCMIVVTIICLLFIHSNLAEPPFVAFEAIFFVYCYFSFFILAYFVAILRNTVDLILISRNVENAKGFYERANEVRVDMIFQYLYSKTSPEETKKLLKDYITHYIEVLDDSEEMKNELKKYFSEYYSFEDKE